MIPDRLRLRATDVHDLLIMGSCVQDSLAPAVSMHFDNADKSFTLLLNRFMWEAPPEEEEPPKKNTPKITPQEGVHHYRTHSGLRFSHVERVQLQGFNPKDPEITLNLLSIHWEKKGVIRLLFSGGGVIQLKISEIEAHLFDVEDAWLSPIMPRHFFEGLEEGISLKEALRK